MKEKFNDKHLAALAAVGFDLNTEKTVMAEYFEQQRNLSTFFKEENGELKSIKTRSQIINMIVNLATRQEAGIEGISLEVCNLLDGIIAKRKKQLEATLDEQIQKAKAEVARLEALRA